MKHLQLFAENILELGTGFNQIRFSSLKERSGLHSHDFYEFFICIKGSILHRINGSYQDISEGSCVFIRPWDEHYYEEIPGKDFDIVNFAFSEEIFLQLYQYLGHGFNPECITKPLIPKHFIATASDITELLNCLDILNRANDNDIIKCGVILRGLLAQWIIWCFVQNGKIPSNLPLWIENVTRKMNNLEALKEGLAYMLEISYKTHEYLCSAFKKHFRQTPTQYINNLRLDYARNMLLNTDMPIVDIAAEVGLENLSHFYHVFKKKFDQTPASIRRNYQKTMIP